MSTQLYISGEVPEFVATEYPTVRTCYFHDRLSEPGQSFGDDWPTEGPTARFTRQLLYSTPLDTQDPIMLDREDAMYLALAYGVGANLGDGTAATAEDVKRARLWFRKALIQASRQRPGARIAWYGLPIVWNYDHTLYPNEPEKWGFLSGALAPMLDGLKNVALMPALYDQRTGQAQVDPNDDWANGNTWEQFIDEGMRNSLRIKALCEPAPQLLPVVSDRLYDVSGDPAITDDDFLGDFSARILTHAPDGLVYWNSTSYFAPGTADARIRQTLDVLVEVCA